MDLSPLQAIIDRLEADVAEFQKQRGQDQQTIADLTAKLDAQKVPTPPTVDTVDDGLAKLVERLASIDAKLMSAPVLDSAQVAVGL